MKKLTRMLACALLCCALVSAPGVTAFAEGDVVSVTVADGDSVLGICQRLGVDFYTYKSVIKTLNGFTSDTQLENITVGSMLYLPASNERAAYLTQSFAATGTGTTTAAASGTTAGTITSAAAVGSTATAAQTSWRNQVYPSYWNSGTVTTATGTATATTGSGSSVALAAGDTVKYYIVRRTIQSGETLTGIYSAMGLNCNTFSSQILKLNKLSNLNKIRAGQSLLLPVTSADAPVYTVVEHKIVSGETVTGICSAYGLSYSSSKSMLEFLNPDMNFDRIRVGACIYLAVKNTASA